MTNSFNIKLRNVIEQNQSLLCVGLDPDPNITPLKDIFEFNRDIIDSTQNLVCAYKPNIAFYSALGIDGYKILENTLRHIPKHIPVIGDSKLGDVPLTSKFHAKSMFERWEFDATTINAYGGYDSIKPFLDYRDKGIFIWCRSSNPGATEIQDLLVQPKQLREKVMLYEWIATLANKWNTSGNLGVVVGATYPEELKKVRKICPDMPILIPGIGAQAGSLKNSVKYGIDSSGSNAIFNVSRSVIYASENATTFQDDTRRAAEFFKNEINSNLNKSTSQ